jgi:serine/threonine protein kinase
MAISADLIEVGSLVDFYRVEEIISRDEMFSVYRATDTRNQRTVAIKIPTALVDGDSVLYDRLQREAEIGQRLNHPSILKVLPDEHRSGTYLVTEWRQGNSLSKVLSEEKLSPERAVKLMIAILDALKYIHVNGVFHRDLSPDSIMVDANDRILILDFGLAGAVAARRLTYTNMSASLSASYISPEQVQGKRGDARSDIYAAGVIFYEMLTNKLPFVGDNALAAMNARLTALPMPPSVANPAVSPQLQEVIYRALEKDPRQRYASAREFKHDLEHLDQIGVAVREEERLWRKGNSPKARKAVYLLLIILLPALLFALLFLWK